MKKTVVLLLFLFLLLSLTACSDSLPDDTASSALAATMNETISIYDSEHHLIADIEHYGAITQTDTGFIYSKLSADSTEENYVMDYEYYDFYTNEKKELGTIENWGYEASYDTFYSNGHVYLLVTTGNIQSPDKMMNYLYDINIEANTMTAFLLKDAASPYNSMTLAGDKIYIVAPGNERCIVSCYNLEDKSISGVKEYHFNSETKSGETIRHISSDGEYIYLLRLYVKNESDAQMYMDTFDLSMSPVSSMEITDDITANAPTIEKNNELRQLVSHFDVSQNIVYYENFSITRALFEIPTPALPGAIDAKSKEIYEPNGDFYKASGISNSKGIDVFYEVFTNEVFVMDTNASRLQEYTFSAQGQDCYITYMTCNSQGDALLFLSIADSENPDSSETQPNKNMIYYININDLK